MSDKIEFLTPVGRLVQGSLFEPNTTDSMGAPLVVKHGPNAGQPRVEYFFAIAIPKTDVGFNDLYGKMITTAKAAFPQHFDASGNPSPNLNLKLVDGDSTVPDQKGNAPCNKSGFPGNWVVRFSGGFAPGVYDNSPQVKQIVDPNAVKRGYFVQVSGTMKANGTGTSPNPGIYMNHSMVRLVGYGEEIQSGPDASQVFTQPAPVPQGASAAPLAPSSPMPAGPAPVAPGAPALPQPTFIAPAPAPALAPVTPVALVAPAVPAPAPAPAPVGASPSNPTSPAPDFLEPKFSVDGNVYTKVQLEGFGWTAADIAKLAPVA